MAKRNWDRVRSESLQKQHGTTDGTSWLDRAANSWIQRNEHRIKQERRAVKLADIESGKTKFGGYTKKQLAEWGIPWPPKKGWKKKLEGKA